MLYHNRRYLDEPTNEKLAGITEFNAKVYFEEK